MKSDLGRLKLRLFGKTMLLMLALVALGWTINYFLIDGVWQEPFAEGFVHVMEKLFSVSYERGVEIYSHIFRENKLFLTICFYMLLLMIGFYIVMSHIMRYFSQIVKNVGILTDETDKPVQFSKEIRFIENRFNDVKSELVREREAREASEKRKDDLIVYLAHDLKTPLTSVVGYLELLNDRNDLTEEQREHYTRIALDKSLHLEELINEFFDITRYNIHSIELSRGDVHLKYMLEQIADEFYPNLMEKGQSAVVDMEEDIVFEGDADKLARVFNNILKNAVAYGEPDSEILIRAGQEGDRIFISFSNHCRQIAEEELSSLFEKFYRGDASRSSYAGGSGLGLAIARDIVEAHGGTIRASSQEGTICFSIELPGREAPKKKKKRKE